MIATAMQYLKTVCNMTPTLLLFLLSLSCVVQGQKNTVRPSSKTIGNITVYDKSPVDDDYIGMHADSTIQIHGDTLRLLRMIFLRSDSLSRADYEFVKIAVDFVNTVPAYLKKGKAWNNFLAEIRRRGYRVNKKN